LFFFLQVLNQFEGNIRRRGNMMQAALIALISGIIVTFSVQNTEPVTVWFLLWKFETSFLWITIAAVFAGMLLAQMLHAMTSKRRTFIQRRAELMSRRHRW
jgi:uncharacterized integral membrane protein